MGKTLNFNALRPQDAPVPVQNRPTFRGDVAGAEAAATGAVKPGTERATAVATAPIPTPAIFQELSALRSKLNSANTQLNRAKTLYDQSVKGKEPWRIAREYFPSAFGSDPVADKIKRFNTAASQLYSLTTQITRTPGEGSQDRMEFGQKLEAFKPTSGDSDAIIEEKLLGLQQFINGQMDFVNNRIGEVKKPTPNINAAKVMMGVTTPKTIVFDKFGNRVK